MYLFSQWSERNLYPFFVTNAITTSGKGEYENFQRYIGKFPKRAMIYGKNKKYRVDIDQNGNIIKADELDYRPEERPHFKEKDLETE